MENIKEYYQNYKKQINITIIIIVVVIIITKLYNKRKERKAKQAEEDRIRQIEENKTEVQKLIESPEPSSKLELAELLYSRAQSDSDPVIIQALEAYKEALNSGYEDAYLRIGEIYHFCNIPERGIPDLKVARASYDRVIKSRATSQENKITANMHLSEINKESIEKNMGRGPSREERAPPNPRHLLQVGIPVNNDNAPVRKMPKKIKNRIRNDSQNVHDSSLQKTFQKSIEQLKKLHKYNNKAIPQKDTIAQVRDYILNGGFEQERTQKALSTLDTIEGVNSNISAVGLKESEILTLVWNRIYHNENMNNRENIKEILVQQLEDAAVPSPDGGYSSVCASGRATRMVSALDNVDKRPIGELKPKWAIKQEIMNKAGVIRNQTLSSMSPQQQAAYNTGGNDNQSRKMSMEATKKIKSAIRTQLNDEYTKTNLVDKKEMDEYLKEILENI